MRRSFHWGDPSSPPSTPLLDSTYTAAPLPRPPQHVLDDPVISATLSRFPHLFSSHSPLNAAAIAEDLAQHPNQPWVESLLLSLQEGFWPGHDGCPSVPPKAAGKPQLHPTKKRHQQVQREWAAEAEREGQISQRFDKLFPGAVVSPQFVLTRNDKDRLIDDHNASGNNDGIGDFPTIYDRVDDLIRIARYLGVLTDDFPSYVVGVKLDVANAFKALLMHLRWQLRQVVAVAYEDGRGGVEVGYHVQFRAAFGSKASPYLWTSFMGAVHFALLVRCPYVDWPLSYMDDTFGLDRTGKRIRVDHDGEARMVPAMLGQMMRVWIRWWIPWKWRKADWGRILDITGFVLDLDAKTLSLSASAVAAFAAEIAVFLDFPGRNPPLRRWRQLAGWATWALTVRPLARPLLTPIYHKLRLPNGEPRPHSPYTGVYINKEVREAFTILVADLLTGDPLDLRGPGLSHWTMADADVLVHTDACTDADDGSGNGLGFFFVYRGERFHYFSRPGVRYGPIQVAECLTVAYAVLHICSFAAPDVRRLLIRTDSSPTVYAYDSGAAADPLRHFLIASFDALRSSSIDLRVHHISGRLNRTADALSRHLVPQLLSTYGSSLYSFVPPAALVGRALSQ